MGNAGTPPKTPPEQAENNSFWNLHFYPCRHRWQHECWGTSQQPRVGKRPGSPADSSSARLPSSLPRTKLSLHPRQHRWLYTSTSHPLFMCTIPLSLLNFRAHNNRTRYFRVSSWEKHFSTNKSFRTGQRSKPECFVFYYFALNCDVCPQILQ